jgi:hypothetical protein
MSGENTGAGLSGNNLAVVKGTAHGWVNRELWEWKSRLASTVEPMRPRGEKMGAGNQGSP